MQFLAGYRRRTVVCKELLPVALDLAKVHRTIMHLESVQVARLLDRYAKPLPGWREDDPRGNLQPRSVDRRDRPIRQHQGPSSMRTGDAILR